MLSVVMLNAVMLNVVMLNVIMMNVVMLNVVMLNVIMLNAIMLNVIMLSVGVSLHHTAFNIFLRKESLILISNCYSQQNKLECSALVSI
jgi:hypothetical protein